MPYKNDNDHKSALRQVLPASSIGFAFVISMALGTLMGYWLDGKLGTKPYLTIFFLFIGIAAGFRSAYYLLKQAGLIGKADK